MTTTERDLLIRTALTPAGDVRAPADLADEIGRSVRATPQRQPRWGASLAGRWSPQFGPGQRTLVIVLLLALSALVVVGVASRLMTRPAIDVVHYHGDGGQTGAMPGPGPGGAVVVDWEHSLDGPMSALLMPLVLGDAVIVADERGTVTTLDAASGGVRWERSVGTRIAGTPAIVGGSIVVATDVGVVVALDPVTGTERWSRDLGVTTTASLAWLEDLVLVGGEDGSVHILVAATGEAIRVVDAGGAVLRSPAISEGTVFVGAAEGRVTAFDARTGSTRWTEELASGEIATPAVVGETLVVAFGTPGGSTPYEVAALGTADGVERWRWTAPSLDRLFIGAVTPDTVFVVSEDRNAYTIDLATGAGRRFFRAGGSVGSLAAIVDGVLYLSSTDGRVHALDAVSGAERWVVEVQGAPTMPVVAGGRVVVGSDLGKVTSIVGSD